MKEKSVFETLSAIDVNKHVEKKSNLSYLPWAWAWDQVKRNFPEATYTIYENSDGLNYHHDSRTAWVKTGVTVGSIEHIEYLPVLDFRNKSITLDKITSFDVNTSIQRSLTKAVARHGLGLYIYAGEDLPLSDGPVEPTETKSKKITLEVGSENWKKVLNFIAVKKDTMGLEEIIRTFSTKYEIPMDVKTSIEKEVEKK